MWYFIVLNLQHLLHISLSALSMYLKWTNLIYNNERKIQEERKKIVFIFNNMIQLQSSFNLNKISILNSIIIISMIGSCCSERVDDCWFDTRTVVSAVVTFCYIICCYCIYGWGGRSYFLSVFCCLLSNTRWFVYQSYHHHQVECLWNK